MDKTTKVILIILMIISLMFFASWFTEKIIFNDFEKYKVQLEEDKEILRLMEEEQEEKSVEESPSNSNIVCSYNAYNCDDFSTCSEVMKVFNTCRNDIHYLDGDDDGIPCESLCG